MALEGYPSPGSVVVGRYRVEAVLGTGGMGAVVKAVDPYQRVVALKFPAPHVRTHATLMTRFVQEATAATRIGNEHVRQIYGVEQLEDGTPFIVMEYLEGTTLDTIIARDAPLAVPRAVHFTLQLLRALQVAHAAGAVHRDIKPANCFVIGTAEEPECLKLIDLGIMKLTHDEVHALTQTSATLGTPAYMAPEQAKSAKAADPRSDLYAVGVILYELLSQKRPFDGESHNELVIKICTEPPLPLRHVRPDLPGPLASIVEHALIKAPNARFQTALAFGMALRPFADARSNGVLARLESFTPGQAPPPVALAHPVAPNQPASDFVQTPHPVPATQVPAVATPAGTPAARESPKTVIADAMPWASPPPPAPPPPPATPGAGAVGPGQTQIGEVSPFAAAAPVGNASMGSPGTPVIPTSNPDTVTSRRGDPGGSSRTPLLVGLGIAAVALIGTGLWLAFGGHSSAPPLPTSESTAGSEPSKGGREAPSGEQSGDDDDHSGSGELKPRKSPGELIGEPPSGTPTAAPPTTPPKTRTTGSTSAKPPGTQATPPSGSPPKTPVPSTTGVPPVPSHPPTTPPTAIPPVHPSTPPTTTPPPTPPPTPPTTTPPATPPPPTTPPGQPPRPPGVPSGKRPTMG